MYETANLRGGETKRRQAFNVEYSECQMYAAAIYRRVRGNVDIRQAYYVPIVG